MNKVISLSCLSVHLGYSHFLIHKCPRMITQLCLFSILYLFLLSWSEFQLQVFIAVALLNLSRQWNVNPTLRIKIQMSNKSANLIFFYSDFWRPLLEWAKFLLDPGSHAWVSSIVQVLAAGLPYQEDHLGHVEQNTDPRHCQHEHGEDCLLRGPRHKTIHRVGTWIRVTLDQPDHLVTGVNHIKQIHERDLEDDTEQEADDVRPPQSPGDFHLLALDLLQVFGVCASRQLVESLVDVAAVGYVHGHQQSRGGHQDELQRPQADVGDGEEVVIADAVAAGLLSVAGEARLLVPPNALGSDHQHQDAENKEDREPDATDASGVSVYTADDSIKRCPVHFWVWVWQRKVSGRKKN